MLKIFRKSIQSRTRLNSNSLVKRVKNSLDSKHCTKGGHGRLDEGYKCRLAFRGLIQVPIRRLSLDSSQIPFFFFVIFSIPAHKWLVYLNNCWNSTHEEFQIHLKSYVKDFYPFKNRRDPLHLQSAKKSLKVLLGKSHKVIIDPLPVMTLYPLKSLKVYNIFSIK